MRASPLIAFDITKKIDWKQQQQGRSQLGYWTAVGFVVPQYKSYSKMHGRHFSVLLFPFKLSIQANKRTKQKNTKTATILEQGVLNTARQLL